MTRTNRIARPAAIIAAFSLAGAMGLAACGSEKPASDATTPATQETMMSDDATMRGDDNMDDG